MADELRNGFLDLRINDCIKGFRENHKDEYELIVYINDFFMKLEQEVVKCGKLERDTNILAALTQLHKVYESAILLFERGLEEPGNILIRTMLDLIYKIVEYIRNENAAADFMLYDKFQLRKVLIGMKKNAVAFGAAKIDIEKEIANLNRELRGKRIPNITSAKLAIKNKLGYTYPMYGLQSSYTHYSTAVIHSIVKRTNEGVYINGDLQLEGFKNSVGVVVSIVEVVFPIILDEYIKSEELKEEYKCILKKTNKIYTITND